MDGAVPLAAAVIECVWGVGGVSGRIERKSERGKRKGEKLRDRVREKIMGWRGERGEL